MMDTHPQAPPSLTLNMSARSKQFIFTYQRGLKWIENIVLNAVVCCRKTEASVIFADGMKDLMSTAILSSWKTIWRIMIRSNGVQINSPDFEKKIH